MAVTIDSVIYLCLVAILWGVTNPFIKKGAEGVENVKAASVYGQFFKEILFLVTKLEYIMPFILNQCGSVLYFLTLQSTDISLAIPVSNSLTFVFTAITGWLLGEEKVHKSEYKTVSFFVPADKCNELFALLSALTLKYLSGNDACTMRNDIVLLGQTE